jgi:predicted permease
MRAASSGLNGLWHDLNHAVRALAKARAFSIVCVASLGIGMVPVVAIPYVSRVFTMPPPGVKTERLAEVLTTRVGSRAATDVWSYPDYADLRGANTGMTLVGWTFGQTEGTKARVRTMFVSTNYFETIGVPLARGVGFSASSGPAVILGNRYWQSEFGSDPDVIGKTLTLDAVPHVVVGIAPDGFDGHLGFNGYINAYLPIERHPRFRSAGTDRNSQWILIHGRLNDGVTVSEASAAVATITSALAAQYPSTNENRAGVAVPYSALGALASSQVAIIQTVALTLTGMVLLVVCLNISGMVQVRSAMRERELSIRQAIGATRRQLIQHVWAEAIVLAALGALVASVILFNLPSLLSIVVDEPLPQRIYDALKVNLPTLATFAGLSFLTSLVCGVLPAIRFSRPVIIAALKDDAGAGGHRAGRVHRVTAALQIAVAVPLIVMTGISLDRFRSTATSDLGFAAESLYAVPLKIDGAKVANPDFRIRAVRDGLTRANAVAAATLADELPLAFRDSITPVALQPEANAAPQFVPVQVTRVDRDYLNTMSVPLLRGREFSTDDRAGTDPVTIISNALAARLFPDADAAEAIGRRLIFGNDTNPQRTLTIVGVSGDFPTAQMSSQREQLLLPLAQQSAPNLFLIARSRPGTQPQQMIATMENAAHDFGPDNRGFGTTDGVAYPTVVTGVWLRKHSMDDFLTGAAVGATAGSVILTLAALGIYGVVGLMVAARTRELAVRTALGATRRRVMGMVLLDVVKLVLPGVVVGMILTAVLMRVNSENMGIPLSDVENVSYLVGAAIAVLIAVAASVAPARRAASIAPTIALRSE